jgi:hypothetical protein
MKNQALKLPNAKPRDGTCPCLPKWVHEYTKKAEQSLCIGCDKEIPSNLPMMIITILMPCSSVHKRVHAHLFFFHNPLCLDQFLQKSVVKGWADTFDIATYRTYAKTSDKLVDDCLKNHKLDGTRCEACDQRGEENLPNFKVCEGCLMVRYCSVECSKNDWANHKSFCKDVRKYRKSKHVQEEERLPKTPACACFDETCVEMHRRQYTSECSNPGCTKEKVYPTNFEVRIIVCPIYNKPHIISVVYCSARCRKRALKK